MKNDIVDVNESDEYYLECEAVRDALADALLRSRDGRLRMPTRTALSSLEEQWVSDVARMLVGASPQAEGTSAPRERGGMRFIRVVRDRMASALGRRPESTILCDAAERDFQYVPVACGQQPDVRKISDSGETGETVARSAIHRSPDK
jgi:hypothetical protein